MRHRLLAVALLSTLALPAFAAGKAVRGHCPALRQAVRRPQRQAAGRAYRGGAQRQGGRCERADIIAMPGDPLADIGNVPKVDFVMKDGVANKAPAP
jgi:hypothetical protein